MRHALRHVKEVADLSKRDTTQTAVWMRSRDCLHTTGREIRRTFGLNLHDNKFFILFTPLSIFVIYWAQLYGLSPDFRNLAVLSVSVDKAAPTRVRYRSARCTPCCGLTTYYPAVN